MGTVLADSNPSGYRTSHAAALVSDFGLAGTVLTGGASANDVDDPRVEYNASPTATDCDHPTSS